MKLCKLCQQDKTETEYYGRSAICKPCQKAKQQKWAEANREKVRGYLQKFKAEKLEHYKQQQLEYRQRNRKLLKEKTLAWRRANPHKRALYQRRLKAKNINYRVGQLLRTRIYDALKNARKSAPTLELLGCSIEDLRQHLQSLFQPGMTWENYGQWHIDHKRPCSSFDLTKPEEQKVCFHYSNLQPLWATENLHKGASFIAT